MQQVQSMEDQRNNHNNYQNMIVNPFEKKLKAENHQFMLEEFIRNWIQSIFYSNPNVDHQSKFDSLDKINTSTAFQHTSCSTIYSMIRDTVQVVAWRLRDAIDHSFDILKSSSRWLYKLSQTSSSWEINWMQFKYEGDPQSFKNIYPPVSNMYINFYKYTCDCVKEVDALWKSIYKHIPVKDLNCQSFQQSINQLILEVFTTGSSTFRPKHMLPVISLANKCRFVNVDKEGALKRMNLTKFKEDELAINLAKASAKKFKKISFNAEDAIKMRQREEKKNAFKNRENRESNRLSSRNRVDTNLIEQIRNQYLDSYKLTTKMQQRIENYKNVFQRLAADEPIDYTDSSCPELLGGFTIEADNSSQSQEDDLNFFQCDEKDELIEQRVEVQVEQMPIFDKFRESEALAKLSASTGIQQHGDHNDILLKHEELENPPDFILQQQFSSMDAYQIDEKEEQLTLQLSKRYLSRANGSLTNEFVLTEKHGLGGHHTVEKCRKKISKQHDKPREHSKCCLEQEKQKLEKYRKELQKEKQELLRQVQRFMKEKDKDTNLYRMAANHFVSKCSRKHGKGCYKYTQEIKQVDFNRYRDTFKSNTLNPNGGIWAKQQFERNGTVCFQNFKEQVDQSFNDEKSTGEATSNSQESWIEQIKNDKKLSKRQQKLRKKIEREMNQFKDQENDLVKSSKTPKESVTEEEAQLSNFLEQLNLAKTNRVACHIEEERLNRWRSKIYTIRNKDIGECSLKDNSTSKQQKKKKKNKNRK